METENTIDLKGKVVKWVDNTWGMINFYREGVFDEAPRKAFVHISKVISVEKPQMGSYVVFDLGSARSPKEWPAALKVRVITRAESL
jgi:hypothetical protein